MESVCKYLQEQHKQERLIQGKGMREEFHISLECEQMLTGKDTVLDWKSLEDWKRQRILVSLNPCLVNLVGQQKVRTQHFTERNFFCRLLVN